MTKKKIKWENSDVSQKASIPGTVFRTQYNYQDLPGDKEYNNKPSMTVPDQSMSIPEIMARFAKGLPLAVGRTEYYDDETRETDVLGGRDIRTLDLSEQHDLAKHLADKAQEAVDKDKEETRKKKQAKYKQQVIEELKIEEEIKNNPDTKPGQ